MQFGGEGLSVPRTPGAVEFGKIVKKEPAKYVSEKPFRGVATLGGQQFAFVLDAAEVKTPPEEQKADSEKAGEQAESKDEAAPQDRVEDVRAAEILAAAVRPESQR